MVLVRRKRMERRGNNTGGASLPLHCQGRFLRLTVITQGRRHVGEAAVYSTLYTNITVCDPTVTVSGPVRWKSSFIADFIILLVLFFSMHHHVKSVRYSFSVGYFIISILKTLVQ